MSNQTNETTGLAVTEKEEKVFTSKEYENCIKYWTIESQDKANIARIEEAMRALNQAYDVKRSTILTEAQKIDVLIDGLQIAVEIAKGARMDFLAITKQKREELEGVSA